MSYCSGVMVLVDSACVQRAIELRSLLSRKRLGKARGALGTVSTLSFSHIERRIRRPQNLSRGLANFRSSGIHPNANRDKRTCLGTIIRDF